MDGANKICFAIVSLTLIEIVALLTGHNGTMLRLVIIAVAGLGGFGFAQLIRRPK